MAPRRPAGLGGEALARVREELAAVEAESRKAPTPNDEPYESDEQDLGPWLETPQSTRVSRFRYDFGKSAIQVQWRNNKNHGYIYEDASFDVYQAMAITASKGRYVNSPLNGLPYRVMTADEVSASSNLSRKRPGFGIDIGGHSWEPGV